MGLQQNVPCCFCCVEVKQSWPRWFCLPSPPFLSLAGRVSHQHATHHSCLYMCISESKDCGMCYVYMCLYVNACMCIFHVRMCVCVRVGEYAIIWKRMPMGRYMCIVCCVRVLCIVYVYLVCVLCLCVCVRLCFVLVCVWYIIENGRDRCVLYGMLCGCYVVCSFCSEPSYTAVPKSEPTPVPYVSKDVHIQLYACLYAFECSCVHLYVHLYAHL